MLDIGEAPVPNYKLQINAKNLLWLWVCEPFLSFFMLDIQNIV